MKSNILLDKSYLFSVNVINAVKILNRSVENYILVRQLLRAATSIGANAEESQGGVTKKILFINSIYLTKKQKNQNTGFVL